MVETTQFKDEKEYRSLSGILNTLEGIVAPDKASEKSEDRFYYLMLVRYSQNNSQRILYGKVGVFAKDSEEAKKLALQTFFDRPYADCLLDPDYPSIKVPSDKVTEYKSWDLADF